MPDVHVTLDGGPAHGVQFLVPDAASIPAYLTVEAEGPGADEALGPGRMVRYQRGPVTANLRSAVFVYDPEGNPHAPD